MLEAQLALKGNPPTSLYVGYRYITLTGRCFTDSSLRPEVMESEQPQPDRSVDREFQVFTHSKLVYLERLIDALTLDLNHAKARLYLVEEKQS